MESKTLVAKVTKVIGEIIPVKELIRLKECYYEKGIIFKEKVFFDEIDWDATKKAHEFTLKRNHIIPNDSELQLKLEMNTHPSDLKWLVGGIGASHFSWKYKVVKHFEIELPDDGGKFLGK